MLAVAAGDVRAGSPGRGGVPAGVVVGARGSGGAHAAEDRMFPLRALATGDATLSPQQQHR